MEDRYTSRRGFLKLGAMAGLGALGAQTLAGCSPTGSGEQQAGTTPVDVKWDGYFDVVVVGFGAAGASAAISAAEAGASVLLVDKAPEGHEGGNSRYCAQLFVSVTDIDEGLKHYQALRGDFYAPDDVLLTYVTGMHNIRNTLVGWGADESEMVDLTDRKISNLTVEYPELPGAESIRTNLIDKTIMAAALWRFLKKAVVARKDKIDCLYESPATALIQDPATKAIVGVEISHKGKTLNIAARNGVIMSLGGYENNPFFTQQFAGYTQMYPIGTLYNEGDGLLMAQAAGAKLWHMGAWESNGSSLIHHTDRVRNTGTKTFFMHGSVVLVGGNGRRYIAEDLEQRHGHMNIGGSWIMPKRPEHNYFIFDEAHVAAMIEGGYNALDLTKITKPFANWSSDLSREIADGKIIKAATLAELAEKLSIDAAGLQETIDIFNQSAASGLDALGRTAATMTAFDAGPYYALEVWPSILNSQGGPERTSKGEVLSYTGKPIPHLYSAGEFGGVTSHLYQGGGNLAECIIFGNISGAEAAGAKSDAFEIDAAGLAYAPGCGELSIYDQTPDATGLAAGTAVGVGEGLGGPIWVKVSANGGSITDVEIVHATETAGVGDVALQQLSQAFVAAGTVEVDGVAGATLSTAGVKAAVTDALSKL
jgi:succinate dehydrogenase/fumarate reductase flavoprotein subunit/uncharacterized protein with FMN-binding domain